jgi:hypothetical protein
VESLTITDVYGKEIMALSNFTSGIIDMQNQKAGMYMIKYVADNRNYVYKLMKE